MFIPFKKRLLVSLISSSVLTLGFAGMASGAFAQEAEVGVASDKKESVDAKSETKPKKEVASQKDTSVEEGEIEQIVVIGARASLESANDIKRTARTVMDSITAVDVGAMPDKSVAEALQRVPGVTVSRFASSSDTQHFSAEPSGVIIRGLEQVHSLFNGRDSFSAESSRGLSWEDITPELMQRVDVYKNQSADIAEGGISGTIDLRTHVPFDFEGQVISASAEVNYSEVTDDYNPNVSILYSNRWETDIGEFGFLGDIAHSELSATSQGVYAGRMGIFEPGSFTVLVPSSEPGGAPTEALTTMETYMPTFIEVTQNEYQRERDGLALAGQWQSNDGTMVATVQYNRSEYNQTNTEFTSLDWLFALWGKAGTYVNPKDWVDIPKPVPGSYFTFDDNGVFQTGSVSSPIAWQGPSAYEQATKGVNDQGVAFVNPNSCAWGGDDLLPVGYKDAYCDEPYDRLATGLESRSRRHITDRMTQDLGVNFKWAPADDWALNFDAQVVDADKNAHGATMYFNSFTGLDLDFTKSIPSLVLTDYTPNVNMSAGGLQNLNNWNYNAMQPMLNKSEGRSYAYKFDAQHTIETTWMDSVRFGVRTSERKQTVQNSNEFRGVAGRWNVGGAAYYNADKTEPATNVRWNNQDTFFAGYPDPSEAFIIKDLSNILGGSVFTGQTLPYFNPKLLADTAYMNQHFSHENLGIGDSYSLCSGLGDRAGELLDSNGNPTCFLPSETVKVDENTNAAYVMLNFGGQDATLFNTNIKVSGNVGVRYVETHTQTFGNISYGQFEGDQLKCEYNVMDPDASEDPDYIPPSTPYTSPCYLIGAAAHNAKVPDMPDMVTNSDGVLVVNREKFYLPDYVVGSPDDFLFRDNTTEKINGDTKYRNWLPSFNLKLDVTDKSVVRFAYSKGISRPDFNLYGYAVNLRNMGVNTSYEAQCKNYNKTTGQVEAIANCTPDPELKFDSSGTLIGGSPRYGAWAGNPELKAITADSFDISFEHYFSGAGLISVALFQKEFKNYITFGSTVVPVTHNGVTRDFHISGPFNGEGASVKGFEISTQKFLDFLPSPYDGIGFQANYTKIYNEGIDYAGFDTSGNQGGAPQGDGGDRFVTVDALPGMSENMYNVALMYEKGAFAFRTAYNWRDKYLVSANDCCNLPVWQDDQGFLDASIRYRFSDSIEVSLQASNLLDTTTKLLQQVHHHDAEVEPGKLVPTAWYKSDQRISLGIRMKM